MTWRQFTFYYHIKRLEKGISKTYFTSKKNLQLIRGHATVQYHLNGRISEKTSRTHVDRRRGRRVGKLASTKRHGSVTCVVGDGKIIIWLYIVQKGQTWEERLTLNQKYHAILLLKPK